MKYYTDENHPNYRDNSNGTTIFINELDEIVVLAWTNYSSATWEYNAIKARFTIDEAEKTATLKHVAIKRKYSPWDDFIINPKIWVSDRMKRKLHHYLSQTFGGTHWRIILH